MCDGADRPHALLLTEGQRSDYKGAAVLLPVLPPARVLIGDKGYDSDAFRSALTARGTRPCIPPRANSPTLYKLRHRIENMFAKLKDWRRIATRYDRYAHTFFSAIYLAITIFCWINL